MTLDEFIGLLDAHCKPGDMVVVEGMQSKRPLIRSSVVDRLMRVCPICWVATAVGKNPDKYREGYLAVSGQLGLDRTQADEIAAAADGMKGEVRNRLLRACKIEE